IVSAQTQTRQRLSSEQSTADESNTVRTRSVGPRVSNHVESQKARPSSGAANASVSRPNTFTWGNMPISQPTPRVAAASNNSSVVAPAAQSTSRLVQPTVLTPKGTGESVNTRVASSPGSADLQSMYIVGAGDVLDIRLPNTTPRESTLFTVLKNGTIEYPLINGPLVVAGMTTDQVGNTLAGQIKVIRIPKVDVSVRDYASH